MLIMLILIEIILMLYVYCFCDLKFLNTHLTNKTTTKQKGIQNIILKGDFLEIESDVLLDILQYGYITLLIYT